MPHLLNTMNATLEYPLAQAIGHSRACYHLENRSTRSHALIRKILRLSGFYRRGQRNIMDFKICRNILMLPRLPAAFDGLTLLHLSDLHLDAHTDFPAALATKLMGLEYDLCVLTGDYRFLAHGPIEPALDGLRRVREAIHGPIYGVLGNHDSSHMLPALAAMNIHILMNEAVALRRKDTVLWLAGIDDPYHHRTNNLRKASDPIPADATAILLAHSPEIYHHAAQAGFDALLCGHTHGGQICLPGGIPLTYNTTAPRHVCRGPWQHQQMQGYTSCGSGSSIVDARFNCRPEITLHRLQSNHAAARSL
ncbi:predicted phosphohydrolase [hydrothermal vent metagenome]|uniref:Predicted phosphohydrolase n=1 Tax=hydrothermal vent metagenome TaxID=652676 RepID=A0A3B1AZT4_9ZZZZ